MSKYLIEGYRIEPLQGTHSLRETRDKYKPRVFSYQELVDYFRLLLPLLLDKGVVTYSDAALVIPAKSQAVVNALVGVCLLQAKHTGIFERGSVSMGDMMRLIKKNDKGVNSGIK